LPYTSFRIARKGFEGIGKVVFPNGEFSTLTTRGDIGRVSFQERLLRTITPSSWEPVTLGASLSKAVVFVALGGIVGSVQARASYERESSLPAE
jgi:hypothetical protein